MSDNLLLFGFKRASCKRSANSTKALINAVVNQGWLHCVVKKLSNDNVIKFKRASLEVEEKKLPSSIKSLESKI